MPILEELTRRRLLQTAALYVAVAWGGTEIIVFLIDALFGGSTGAAAQRYLAILLIAGFPAAMYLAWTRDLGLKARRIVAAAVVAVVIVAVLVTTLPPPDEPGGLAVTENSIAVLPFEVCEDRLSDSALAGGLTGAVLNRLAQRDRLKTMGRRSIETVMKGTTSLAAIASLLKVKYLLQGTVCRDGLDLTLHAELTDNHGFIVWEDDYKQLVNRSDQVEKRLASMIDNDVAAELGDVITAPVDQAVDRRALEQLLIGKEYRRQHKADEARAAFEQAVALQPDYAEALFQLAVLESAACDLSLGDCMERAYPIAERALELARIGLQRNPDGFQENWVAGLIIYFLARSDRELAYRQERELGDEGVEVRKTQAHTGYIEAEDHLRTALSLNPSATEIRVALAVVLDRQGAQRRRESLEILLQGLSWEPFHDRLTLFAARRLVEFGRVREAMELLDRSELLPQGKSDRLRKAQLETLNNLGFFDEKLANLIDLLQRDPEGFENFGLVGYLWQTVGKIGYLGLTGESENLYTIVAKIPDPNDSEWVRWVRQFFLEDNYLGGLGRWMEVVEREREKIAGMSNEEILAAWTVEAGTNAWVLWESGEQQRAIELFEALRHHQVPPSSWAERAMDSTMTLAYMYMQVGRDEDALAVLQEAVSYLQTEVDAGVRHPQTLLLLTEAYGWQGNQEKALKMLELAIDYGAYDVPMCCEDFSSEPEYPSHERDWWAGLEDDPRFIQSRSRMRGLVEQQRSNIRALLAQHDMEQLIAPVITLYESLRNESTARQSTE